VKAKPEYIAIEDLSVTNMISRGNENHIVELSKHIQDSKFYYFKEHLMNKCKYYNIPVHLANKYFASSKKCSNCDNIKKDLTLNDRIYICDKCGFTIDRDLNAARNLVHMKKKDYKIK
jgi:putative transposase